MPNESSPYKLLHGSKPNLDILQTFGCEVFYLNDDQNSGKHDDHGLPGIFAGYSTASKGYIIYSTKLRKFILTRNIKFYEHSTETAKAISQLSIPVTISQTLNANPEISSPDPEPLTFEAPTIGQTPTPASIDPTPTPDPTTNPIPAPTTPPNLLHLPDLLLLLPSHPPKLRNHLSRNLKPSLSLPNPTLTLQSNRVMTDAMLESIQQGHMPHAKIATDFAFTTADTAEFDEDFMPDTCRTTPTCFEDTIKHKEWREAMDEELLALARNKTWKFAGLPEGRKPISCKWVYRTKLD